MRTHLEDLYALQALPPEGGDALRARPTPLQALQAQRARGFWGLRFQGCLESAFRDYFAASGRETRFALLLISMFMLALTPWYSAYLLQEPAAFALYSRPLVYGQIPAVIAGAVVVWFWPYSPWADRLCIIVCVVNVASILAQRSIGTAYGFDVPLAFVGTALTALLVASRTRFWYLLPCVVLGTAAMVLTEWLLVSPPPAGYYLVIATLMLIAIACVGGYSIEYFMRQTWINSCLLHYISRRDGLTDLLNRKALEGSIQNIVAHARRERDGFGIAMIDIDYFKAYNDSYGHRAGDTVICRVADVLCNAARRPQDFCGRYGGEEFALVWTDGPYDELCALAERLRRDIEQTHMHHTGSTSSDWVTVSIGLYWLDARAAYALAIESDRAPDESVARLLDAADKLLYKAKAAGRNRVVSARARP